MQVNDECSDILVRDVSGGHHPLRVFFSTSNAIVLSFHDGFEAFPSLIEALRPGRPLLLMLTCSWFVSLDRAHYIARAIRKSLEVRPGKITKESFLIVANSELERAHFKSALPDIQVVHANNSAFIDEQLFPLLDREKSYDAVLNAKVNTFKRHYLSAEVKSKVFVSYRTAETADDPIKAANLESLAPKKIFWNLNQSQVSEALSTCKVGMMLSAEEGACYASLEYLLTGLPVVSTPSVGGREDFYTPECSVIAPASADGVQACVEQCRKALDRGDLSPLHIRSETIPKMHRFRDILNDAIDLGLKKLGAKSLELDIVHENIKAGSKFSTTRNFWMKAVELNVPHDQR